MNHSASNTVKLHGWYDALQRTSVGSKIVEQIEQRISLEKDNHESIKTLTSFLASELRRQERYIEAERVLLDLATRFPCDPAPLISLAEQKLYFEQRPVDALGLADRAWKRAHLSANFRRQVLGVRARIARELERYDIVEDVLRGIMNLQFEPGNIDIGVERDFFDSLPKGAINQALSDQYEAFARSELEE